MPGRAVHIEAGAVLGGLAASVRAPRIGTPEAIAEILGGTFLGMLGGVMPDILEPATHPSHRKMAHSLATAGALLSIPLVDMQAHCRSFASAARSRAASYQVECPERDRALFEALCWHVIAGAVAGFLAGYLSHLALDATTSYGLPVAG